MRDQPSLYLNRYAGSFGILQALVRLAARFGACRRAAVAPLTAIMLIPMAGALAFAVELGSWQYMQRSAQNAADSAALAAATVDSASGTTGTTTSEMEALAAAANFGYVDGTNNVTVTVEDTVANAATLTCPAGVPVGSTCYRATITSEFPLLFSRVLGFAGSGGGVQQIVSSAISINKGGSLGSATTPCVWAFSDLQGNGTPFADLTGCSVLSSGTMGCTGGEGNGGLQADYAVAAGMNDGGCAANADNDLENQTVPSDPYAALATNIPTEACGSNPTSGTLTGKLYVYCGNVTLSNNLTFNSPDTVVVIRNGTLDLNNKTLSSGSDGSVTIIFDGTSPPFGDKNMKGTIDIKAPDEDSSSAWKGVAIYRKPSATSVDATLAGSKATWKITGLVYLPKTNVTLSGAVNHSSTGATCFILVGDYITINGNGQILQTTAGCNAAGTTTPTLTVGGGSLYRERLVR